MTGGTVGLVAFSQEWHAFGREAQLALTQITSGVNVLGRADYAHQGYYTQAFFGLSIGIERLAKLIIVADYAVANAGQFPTNDQLKNIGHDVATLVDRCALISAKRRAGKEHADCPSALIHKGIIKTLTEFGKLTRYYNLDLISQGQAPNWPEPVRAWWERVGLAILAEHYSTRLRERDAAKSAKNAALMQPSFVLFHTEAGVMINDIETLLAHADSTSIVQKYGRLYTLQIVRWLAFLISDLSRAHQNHIESLSGLGELFVMFMQKDQRLRDRTTWSIYGR
jgi:hypothetical protein